MKLIGLTGGIASGKTAVSRMIIRRKLPLIDGDLLAREVVEPGKPAYNLIIKNFSRDVLNEDGTLDRAKLADIIFSDEQKRKILNRCTHPYIRRKIFKLLAWYWATGEKLVVLDAPLLIESGLYKWMSAVVVIYVSEQLQLHRLIKRDNIQEHAALQRISAQMPIREKIKYADHVIDNSSDLGETERQLNVVLAKVYPTWWNWLITWLGPPTIVVLGLAAVANSKIK
ncbi:dephospho-CoA kinase [Rhizophagus irregularis]|uniref:Dephospho-CoA kinase n=3 Tax=Rhizophagus irregularis TaxID=588596 RepID=A0A2I1GRW0_9GLOM|nr:dephospho-CoA kinase [Rhizophagus irregularis DAOM 181602=DAOM 197198]EXX72906.1 putative dephospho-CoA kinase [Rhizophagus irregularis DAOM 197198w]PKC15723.1 dephospho-CoA kinase [Rhizophagus irregularis]EXX79740.1 putative dephospho-CoA kinase [Rhizophagus irregularis DAOM 197198w]PKC72911.1 dephospho-CoA kinase [Rhizophagus irregularis]PKK72996.1 dephospho-CoA kinase [Rhizophagus irregularis]|eukprot:XP_025190113.1 dephospho-CoA kinase [Rhizophagus irregularis DAOM 181602=DAOM 197198]